MCEWQRVSLFPEGPGPCRCPASSSYTVYTKLCMYKIEKSAKKTRKEMCYSQTVLFYWETTFRSFASWILSLLSTRRKEMWGHYYYLESGLCAQANCPLHNREHWLPSWSLQRYAAGPVTEKLCRKSRSRREIDPVSSYKQHRPSEREAAQTLRNLNPYSAPHTARCITVDISDTQQPLPHL